MNMNKGQRRMKKENIKVNSIQIWCEPVCSGCGKTLYGVFYKKGVIEYLREYAKNQGWKVYKGNTYCPDCIQKIKGE